MEAKDMLVTDLIGKKNSIFYVPLYQRKYTWEAKKAVQQLWNDLLFFKNTNNSDYFLGSIIIKKTSDLNSKYILVDGQQRITTLFLLISALKKLSQKDSSTYFILKSYLDTDDNKFKLERINDSNIINYIMNDKLNLLSDEDKKSRYYENYKYFYNEISKCINDYGNSFVEDFKDNVLEKIKLAIINLNEKEDEYNVFESINSKGEKLAVSDLIKNYIYMLLDQDEEILKDFENDVIAYFDKYKNPDSELVSFYRQLLAIDTGVLYSEKNASMYLVFKAKFQNLDNKNQAIKEYIAYLKKSKIIYDYISKHNFGLYSYPLLKGNFKNFYHLIHVIVEYNSTIINNELIINNEQESNIQFALKYLSKLVVYRALVNFGRVEGNRKYAKLSYDLKRELDKNTNSSFKEIFSNIVIKDLNNSTSNYRMPNINEVENIDSKTDLYTNNKTNLKYILLSIEESLSGKKMDKTEIDELEIEHIFPQRDDKWDDAIQYSTDDIQTMSQWLNTIGNLSLINSIDNKKISNKSFHDKLKLLADISYLKINKLIYSYELWNVDNIKDRANELIKMIKNIWGDDSDNDPILITNKNLDDINNKLFFYKDGVLFRNNNWYLKQNSIIYKFESDFERYKLHVNMCDKFINQNLNNLKHIENNKYELLTDLVVSSPSFAAQLVANSGAKNGNITWKDIDDIQLGEYV